MQIAKLFILCLLTFPFICVAQDEKKPIKFILQPSVGVNLTNKSFMTGALADHLIAQRTTPSLCLQLSAIYFYKNWGFGSTL